MHTVWEQKGLSLKLSIFTKTLRNSTPDSEINKFQAKIWPIYKKKDMDRMI